MTALAYDDLVTRRVLMIVGLVLVAACSQNASDTPTSVAPTTAPPDWVTSTSSTSTTAAALVSTDVPRIGSTLENQPLTIRVIEDAVLHVDGSCVTAETDGKTLLLVFDLREAWVLGPDVRFEDLDPDTPTLVLSSGARYQFRGVPDPFDAELAEPMPPGCEYDERLMILGALDTPVAHGLPTRPVEVYEAVATIGIDSTTITIDGACTTISHPTGELLVIWSAGTVSLLDDHTIHMSRWEAIFTEVVVRSGDTLLLFGANSDRLPESPPPGCEYDGTFWVEVVRPASG